MNDRRPAGRRSFYAYRQRFTIAQPQKILCYPEQDLFAGAWGRSLNKQKTTRFPEWKTGGLCQSGYQVALLARLQLMLQNLHVSHCFVEVSSNYDIVFWARCRQFLLAKNNANGCSGIPTASGY